MYMRLRAKTPYLSTVYSDNCVLVKKFILFCTPGGQEEGPWRPHCRSVQPHEVPPLHGDLEEGGDRGLTPARHGTSD